MTTTTALTVNQILRQGGLILTSVLLAKSNIGTENIGNFETLSYVTTALSFFWLTSITQTSLSFLSDLSPADKKNAGISIFGLLFVIAFLFFGTSILFNTQILSWLTKRTYVPFFNWFALSQIFILPTFVAENILTVDNRPKQIVRFGVLSYIVPVFIFLLPIWIGYYPTLLPLSLRDFNFLELSYIGLFIYSVFRFLYVVFFILEIRFRISDNPKYEIRNPKSEMRAFVGLCVPMLGYFFLNQFSTVFINGWVCAFAPDKPEIFAQFRYGAREFPLVSALVAGLSNSYTPMLASGKATLNDLKKKSVQTAHIIFPISILLLLSSKFLFPLVFNPAFSASVPVFNIYVLLVMSRAIFPQTVLLSLKDTRTLLYVSVLETLFIVITCTFLLNQFGPIGAAWSVVTGFLLEKILLAMALRRFHNISFDNYTPVKIYSGYCCLILGFYVLSLRF
jgi:O-antigen/teichoic acid export membrane protein